MAYGSRASPPRLQQLMEHAEDAEEGESAQQRQPGARAAFGGAEPHEPEADAEEEREDREEPVLHEVFVEAIEGQRVAVGIDRVEVEQRGQVDQQDPAQGEAANDVESEDSGPATGGRSSVCQL